MRPADPKNINSRLYNQLEWLLNDLEDHSRQIGIRDRIAALTAIGRLQVIFMGLRKESGAEANAGSAVRKYAGAFTPHAVGGGKKGTRSRKTAAGRAATATALSDLDAIDADTDAA